MEKPVEQCVICEGCFHWENGEGTTACLSCKKIDQAAGSMEKARKKHVYMPYPPEESTRPDYDSKIDAFDSVDILDHRQFAVLLDRGLHNRTWGEIGKIRCMNRQNAKRTYKRAIRRLCEKA